MNRSFYGGHASPQSILDGGVEPPEPMLELYAVLDKVGGGGGTRGCSSGLRSTEACVPTGLSLWPVWGLHWPKQAVHAHGLASSLPGCCSLPT